MSFVSISNNNRQWPKMAKAKTVRKIADMWLSKAKSYFYYFF